MIQIIVSAFVEDSKENAIVEVVFASSDHYKVQEKYVCVDRERGV